MDAPTIFETQIEWLRAEARFLDVSDRLGALNGQWMRSARRALLLSTGAVAERLGKRRSNLCDLEEREGAGAVTINAMTQVAQAMDCEFVYGVHPLPIKKPRREMSSSELYNLPQDRPFNWVEFHRARARKKHATVPSASNAVPLASTIPSTSPGLSPLPPAPASPGPLPPALAIAKDKAYYIWRMNHHSLVAADVAVAPYLNQQSLDAPGSRSILAQTRAAIGLNAAQLAQRLGVCRSSYCNLEKREATGAITLKAMAKAAHAMGYEFTYAVRPRKGALYSRLIWAEMAHDAAILAQKHWIPKGAEARMVAAFAERLFRKSTYRRSKGWTERLSQRLSRRELKRHLQGKIGNFISQ